MPAVFAPALAILLLRAPVTSLQVVAPATKEQHRWRGAQDACMTICGDEALCRPLGSAGSHLHHMPRPADEVVAFPSYELYGAGVNGTEERNYDWSKITSVAPFEPMGRWKVGDRAFGEVYCEAHRGRARPRRDRAALSPPCRAASRRCAAAVSSRAPLARR